MKVLLVFGTRPEAIKMAPLIHALRSHPFFEIKICVTAQHREMLDHVLNFFEIVPDFDLNIMRKGQNITDLTCNILSSIQHVYTAWPADMILVHGDTITSFTAALAAYFQRIAVGHIEAGLRTGNKYSPWPEEMNRMLTGQVADIHFAPTVKAKEHLLTEGIAAKRIHVTGNTVIDALHFTLEKLKNDSCLQKHMTEQFAFLEQGKKIILITGHRRENFGEGFSQMCDALSLLAQREDVQLVYPVHLNPTVQDFAQKKLAHLAHCTLLNPLDYPSFVYLMSQSHVILTDSGGVQEEACGMGKPVLIMRNTTERTEALDMGITKIVGTQSQSIVNHVCELLDNPNIYKQMAKINNIYGDGTAAKNIVRFLENYGNDDA